MRIIDGIKRKGRRVEIPDCDRGDLPQFFVDMGYKVGVEVGVYKAGFTQQFAKAGLRIIGVDPWRAYGDYDEKVGKFQDRQDFLFGHAMRTLAPYPNAKLIRATSMEAVQHFPDNSLDFVYIDGHHGFKYVAEDIWEWSKKVRPGGCISGHDYARNNKQPNDPYTLHVKYVVDAYTEACGIDNWYVLGAPERKEGEKRDTWRSWLWIKE